jgi:CIC family chloride channel protein
MLLARYYEDARSLAKSMTEWSKSLSHTSRRFIVCSGGGPGIMEAANRGASEAHGISIGLGISLPDEPTMNDFITREMGFEFHYFFMRKFWFVYLAKALVVFPGGFGTMDELFELLTLVQTRKSSKTMPIVLYGRTFWHDVLNFDALIRWGTISAADLSLFHIADTPRKRSRTSRASFPRSTETRNRKPPPSRLIVSSMRLNAVRVLAWLRLAIRRRFRQDERAYAIGLTLAVGAWGAVAAVAIRFGGLAIQWLVIHHVDEPVQVARSLGFPMIVIIPAAGGLIYGLLVRLFRPGRGAEGTSEIMEAVSLSGSARLDLPRSIKNSAASVVLNAMGGSVGREGPIVQLASAGASRFAQALRVPLERRRVLIGCGAAAGMAAAYNAPIGAAMFVMEIVHGNFALEVFGPVVLASVTATMVSWGAFGSAPLYPVPLVPAPSLVSLPLFAVLGALVAWTGVVFRGGVDLSERFFKRLPLPLEARAAIGGLVVGLLAWWIPEVWGNGYDGVREVLAATVAPAVLLPLLVAKIAATSASLGSGGSGGVFTPALLIGAAAGAVFGLGAEMALPALHIAPVFFVLAGMTAAIASTTFAPITAMIMVFEMCQNYGAVMPLAVVTVTATWVARSLRRDSIYTESLRRRGVDFDVAFEQMALATLRAEDLIRTDPLTVAAEAPVAEVLDLFARSRGTAVYVTRDGRLIGAIDLRDAFQVAGAAKSRDGLTATDLVRDVPRVTPMTPLDEVMRRFSQLELAQLPVVALHDPEHLVGSVARRDVVSALDREVLRRRMLLAQYLGAPVPAEVGTRQGGALAIDELPVPAAWVGRTLQQADPYRQTGLFVLAVKPAGKGALEEIAPVPSEHMFEAGDRVVLLGSKDVVRAPRGLISSARRRMEVTRSVRTFDAAATDAGRTVQRLLHEHLGVSNAEAKGLIAAGCVTRNGKRVQKPDDRAAENDRLAVGGGARAQLPLGAGGHARRGRMARRPRGRRPDRRRQGRRRLDGPDRRRRSGFSRGDAHRLATGSAAQESRRSTSCIASIAITSGLRRLRAQPPAAMELRAVQGAHAGADLPCGRRKAASARSRAAAHTLARTRRA